MSERTTSNRRRNTITAAAGLAGAATAGAILFHPWSNGHHEAAPTPHKSTARPSATAEAFPTCSPNELAERSDIVSGFTFLQAKIGSCANKLVLKNTPDAHAAKAVVPENETPVLKDGDKVLLGCQTTDKNQQPWVQVYIGDYEDSNYGFLPAQVFGGPDQLVANGAPLQVCQGVAAD